MTSDKVACRAMRYQIAERLGGLVIVSKGVLLLFLALNDGIKTILESTN